MAAPIEARAAGLVVLLLAGCVAPGTPDLAEDEPHQQGLPPSEPDDAVFPSSQAWDEVSASGCMVARLAIASQQTVFPFAPPDQWPGPRMLQMPSFFFQVYTCTTVIVGTEHVIYNASFAWESHDNMSWRENPTFDSNSLQGLMGFYVQNETLAGLLEEAGLNITRAEVELSGEATEPVAKVRNSETSIMVSLQGFDYISGNQSEILHVVPSQFEGGWLRMEMLETVQHNYAPWNFEATGNSATARMARSLEAQVPSLNGYAAEGSVRIAWEAGFG